MKKNILCLALVSLFALVGCKKAEEKPEDKKEEEKTVTAAEFFEKVDAISLVEYNTCVGTFNGTVKTTTNRSVLDKTQEDTTNTQNYENQKLVFNYYSDDKAWFPDEEGYDNLAQSGVTPNNVKVNKDDGFFRIAPETVEFTYYLEPFKLKMLGDYDQGELEPTGVRSRIASTIKAHLDITHIYNEEGYLVEGISKSKYEIYVGEAVYSVIEYDLTVSYASFQQGA